MQYEVRWPDGRSIGVYADALMDAEWTPQGPCAWDVRMGTRNHRVLLLEGPDASGNLTLRVDGVKWSGCVADDRKLLLERMGMGVDEVVQDQELVAPMPGKVLAVSVKRDLKYFRYSSKWLEMQSIFSISRQLSSNSFQNLSLS